MSILAVKLRELQTEIINRVRHDDAELKKLKAENAALKAKQEKQTAGRAGN